MINRSDQKRAWQLAFQNKNNVLVDVLRSTQSEIVSLTQLNRLITHPATKLLGNPLSLFKSYLTNTPYQNCSIENSEVYFRSGKHPLANLNPTIRYGNEDCLQQGGRAHVGDFINPMQLVGDYFIPNTLALPTTRGNAALYDVLLNYQYSICQLIASYLTDTLHLQIGTYNRYPCVMVFVKDSTIVYPPGKTTIPTIPAMGQWTTILSCLFVGLMNARAYAAEIPIEMVRRSSFGFLRPTVAVTGRSFRINVGLIPQIYALNLVATLRTLDDILKALSTTYNAYPIQNNIFCKSSQYKAYINNEHHPIFSCTNLFQLLWSKAERGQNGQLTLQNIMRTPFVRQKMAANIFNSMILDTTVNIVTVFVNVLNLAISQLTVTNNRLTYLQKNEQTIQYNTSFECLNNIPAIADVPFWNVVTLINQRANALTLKPVLLQETLNNLQQCYTTNSVEKIYFYYEVLNECLLHNAIAEKEANSYGDGYGSDSDEEDNIDNKRIYAKKIIVHNGMRAILTTILGITRYYITYYPTYRCRIYATSDAYYEVVHAIKTINTLHRELYDIQQVKDISICNTVILDMNACVTNGGININNLLATIRQAKNAILILDATSATTAQCREFLRVAVNSADRLLAVCFVSSGLKHEQLGADRNHYGTVRIFTDNKQLRDEFYNNIKRYEPPALSGVSHAHRRSMKEMGVIPTNLSFFRPPQPEPVALPAPTTNRFTWHTAVPGIMLQN